MTREMLLEASFDEFRKDQELESVEKQRIYFVLHCVYRADILLFK